MFVDHVELMCHPTFRFELENASQRLSKSETKHHLPIQTLYYHQVQRLEEEKSEDSWREHNNITNRCAPDARAARGCEEAVDAGSEIKQG